MIRIDVNNIRNHAVKARDFLFDIIFPKSCIGCGVEGIWLCEPCLEKIRERPSQSCLECKKTNNFGDICPACQKNYRLTGVLVAGNYNNSLISKAIKLYKYDFIEDLGSILGNYLADELDQAMKHAVLIDDKMSRWPEFINNRNDLVVIPVPLHPQRLRWRGFNQAASLAEVVCARLALARGHELQRVRYRKPQAKLKRIDRLYNLRESFDWQNANLSGKNIILVDDVVTTGSTLNECAKVLKMNGAHMVWGLVLAHG